MGARAVSSDKAAVKLGGITVIRLHGHPHFQTVGFYFYLFNYYYFEHLSVKMDAYANMAQSVSAGVLYTQGLRSKSVCWHDV
jgi:hypothetical protein